MKKVVKIVALSLGLLLIISYIIFVHYNNPNYQASSRKVKQDISQLNNKITDLKKERKKLEDTINDNCSELNELKKKLAQLEADLTNATDNLNSLN